jgi:uracil-DNA glycosylase
VTSSNDADVRAELAELTAAVRAHVAWLVESGASGVPRGERSATAAVTPEPDASPVHAPAPARAAPAAAPRVSAPAPTLDVASPVVTAPAAAVVPLAPAAGVAPAPAAGVVPALDPAERKRRLDVLGESIRGCTKCALHAGRTQTVFARGTGSARLCFVGEGPGADEDAQGFPFVGKAGQLLDRMIVAMGMTRDEVYVCNIVKCRPPDNRKPEPAEMAACLPYLKEQLELVGPEVIVALGATAVQGLFGTTEGITRMRGRWKLYGGRIPVMPTFHPAYLLRTPSAKREVWDDLQAVLRQMGRQLPPKG